MRKRKWGHVLVGSGLGFCVGTLSMAGCEKPYEQPVTIQLWDVTKAPVCGVAVIPVHSASAGQGWWEQAHVEVYADTLWSDSTGQVQLPAQSADHNWNALHIELDAGSGRYRTYHVPLSFEQPIPALQRITVPSSLSLQFVGNRIGNAASAGCWIKGVTGGTYPDTSDWFTPGVPPRPSLIKTVWIHPNDSFPVRRAFRMLLPSGAQEAIPPVLIQAEDLGDTLIHSIEF